MLRVSLVVVDVVVVDPVVPLLLIPFDGFRLVVVVVLQSNSIIYTATSTTKPAPTEVTTPFCPCTCAPTTINSNVAKVKTTKQPAGRVLSGYANTNAVIAGWGTTSSSRNFRLGLIGFLLSAQHLNNYVTTCVKIMSSAKYKHLIAQLITELL